MLLAAGDSRRRVVLADGFFVWPFRQAVHRACGIVVQIDLADAELAGSGVACVSAICAVAAAGSFRSS